MSRKPRGRGYALTTLRERIKGDLPHPSWIMQQKGLDCKGMEKVGPCVVVTGALALGLKMRMRGR